MRRETRYVPVASLYWNSTWYRIDNSCVCPVAPRNRGAATPVASHLPAPPPSVSCVPSALTPPAPPPPPPDQARTADAKDKERTKTYMYKKKLEQRRSACPSRPSRPPSRPSRPRVPSRPSRPSHPRVPSAPSRVCRPSRPRRLRVSRPPELLTSVTRCPSADHDPPRLPLDLSLGL